MLSPQRQSIDARLYSPFNATVMQFFILCLVPLLVSATNIATFSDDSCQESFRDLEGPNGYPNGTCTQLNSRGPFKSFQLVEEDYGCSGETNSHAFGRSV